MKSKVLWLIVGLLFICSAVHAEDIAWQTDSTAAGGRRQGILVQTPTGETLPVSGTVTAINTVMVSDTVYMDSQAFNAVAGGETTKSLTGVKQIKLKARTGVDVRVATGTGSSTATTYTIISAGETLTLSNLNGISMTLAVLGNASADTGILSLTYTK